MPWKINEVWIRLCWWNCIKFTGKSIMDFWLTLSVSLPGVYSTVWCKDVQSQAFFYQLGSITINWKWSTIRNRCCVYQTFDSLTFPISTPFQTTPAYICMTQLLNHKEQNSIKDTKYQVWMFEARDRYFTFSKQNKKKLICYMTFLFTVLNAKWIINI